MCTLVAHPERLCVGVYRFAETYPRYWDLSASLATRLVTTSDVVFQADQLAEIKQHMDDPKSSQLYQNDTGNGHMRSKSNAHTDNSVNRARQDELVLQSLSLPPAVSACKQNIETALVLNLHTTARCWQALLTVWSYQIEHEQVHTHVHTPVSRSRTSCRPRALPPPPLGAGVCNNAFTMGSQNSTPLKLLESTTPQSTNFHTHAHTHKHTNSIPDSVLRSVHTFVFKQLVDGQLVEQVTAAVLAMCLYTHTHTRG